MERSAAMTQPAYNTIRRPGSVTVVVVLTIISGILTLLGALFLLLLGGGFAVQPQGERVLRARPVSWPASGDAEPASG